MLLDFVASVSELGSAPRPPGVASLPAQRAIRSLSAALRCSLPAHRRPLCGCAPIAILAGRGPIATDGIHRWVRGLLRAMIRQLAVAVPPEELA